MILEKELEGIEENFKLALGERISPEMGWWLITQAKNLVATLKRIKGLCGSNSTCLCGRPNGLPAIIMCIETALEEK